MTMSERFYKYSPPIPKELKRDYEVALDSELRWLGGVQFSDREESDLAHVASMFGIHDENSYRYPSLFAEVDSEETHHMIYLHDAGEILAHDMSHTVPNYDALRQKRQRRESAAFRLLTKKYIHDIELRAYARKLFTRYETKSPDDKLAQYVQLLDKAQATRFGAVFVFPARKLRTQSERQQQANHIFELYIVPATHLSPLVSGGAQEELMEFMDNELLSLRKNGYHASEVDPYRKLMRETLISQREIAFR